MTGAPIITRRTVLVGAAGAAVGVPSSPSVAVEFPIPIERYERTDHRILLAYSNWLHHERMTLHAQIYSTFPGAYHAVPCGTGVDSFHAPYLADREPTRDDCGPNQAPSERAMFVLGAAGADIDRIIKRSVW